MNVEKIREAAERVARSLGLEIADVEWKVGKQRFLRVSIDRVPPEVPQGEPMAGEEAGAADRYGAISHADCQQVS